MEGYRFEAEGITFLGAYLDQADWWWQEPELERDEWGVEFYAIGSACVCSRMELVVIWRDGFEDGTRDITDRHPLGEFYRADPDQEPDESHPEVAEKLEALDLGVMTGADALRLGQCLQVRT